MSLETIRASLNALRAQQEETISSLLAQIQAKVAEHQALCASVSVDDAAALILSGIDTALDARAAELGKRASLAGNLAFHRTVRHVTGFDAEGLPMIETKRPPAGGLDVFSNASALDLLAVAKPALWTEIDAWVRAIVSSAGTPGADDVDALQTAADVVMNELVGLLEQLRQARAELADIRIP